MRNLYYFPDLIPIVALLFAFLITYISIPSLVDVARMKHLYDEPNERTSHTEVTPSLGGMAIFAGFIISIMLFLHIPNIPYIQFVIAGIIVLFFIGLKDDVIFVTPLTKFVAQVFAATIIIDLGNIRLDGFYGLFGINDIGYLGSSFLSVFVIVALINAFNLIDGIDGLASSIGMLASAVFGTWFYLTGNIQLTIVACALFGALLAFVRFNVFSKKYKLFMGDIGSLMLGFIMAVFAIKFNDLNGEMDKMTPYYIKSAPAVSIGILIVPIFDTVRVFAIRLFRGQSPFRADRRHVHHYLLDAIGSHRKSSLIILIANAIFIVIAFLLADHLRIYQLTLVLFGLAALVSYIPYQLAKKKRLNK